MWERVNLRPRSLALAALFIHEFTAGLLWMMADNLFGTMIIIAFSIIIRTINIVIPIILKSPHKAIEQINRTVASMRTYTRVHDLTGSMPFCRETAGRSPLAIIAQRCRGKPAPGLFAAWLAGTLT